jgi:hypothetical protein
MIGNGPDNVTEGGNVYSGAFSHFEDGQSLLGNDFIIIYSNCDCGHKKGVKIPEAGENKRKETGLSVPFPLSL